MNSIEYSLDYVKKYFKIDYTKDDEILKIIIEQAKSYILNYTGLTEAEVSEYKELNYAFLLYVDCAYTQRNAVFEKGEINPMIDRILNLNAKWEV